MAAVTDNCHLVFEMLVSVKMAGHSVRCRYFLIVPLLVPSHARFSLSRSVPCLTFFFRALSTQHLALIWFSHLLSNFVDFALTPATFQQICLML